MGLGLLSGGIRIARPEVRRDADGEVRSISFSVPGEPVGKGRPRFTRTGHPYTPGKTESYESLVRLAYGERVRDGIPKRSAGARQDHRMLQHPEERTKEKASNDDCRRYRANQEAGF